MSGYYLLLNGEYAYNKSYSVGFDFGSIKRLDRYPMGALSTLYICFALKRHDSDFIKTYFDSLKWYKEIYMIAAEGARNHGLLNVPTDDFFSTMHTLPCSLEEQRKIASFFCCLEDRIAHQHRLVDTLKSYKRGLLNAFFSREICFAEKGTWEVRQFTAVADLRKEKCDPAKEAPAACIELEHIEQGTGRIMGHTTTSSQSSIKNKFYPGDVLFGKLRPYLRKYALPGIEGVCSSEIWVLTPKRGILSRYLYYLVQSDQFIASANISSGTKMPRAEWSKICSERIVVPNASEQEKICSTLEALDRRIDTALNTLVKLEQLKNALLQRMFV